MRYSYYAKRNLSYYLLSLYLKCTNYIYIRNKYYKPKVVPLLDYSKINRELERLDKEEEELEAKLRIEEEITKVVLTRAR